MTTTLATLDALNRAVIARGWPALSDWWMATLARFVTSRRRQLVARVGRRGGKSSSLCRFAVAFALAFDVASIPPGDVGVVAFISISRDEASQRLRTIRGLLDVIGVAHRPIENGIELVDRPILFKVFAASIGGVSGFTSILVIADEVAKWKDADTGANPATEVLASVRPTMATQPAALIILSSSALTVSDAHAEAFDAGEGDGFQIVAHAETWIANPSVTEAETHDLERDAKRWRREYQAIPQASSGDAFDADAVDAANTLRGHGVPGDPVLVLDFSSGKKDACTWGVARRMLAAEDIRTANGERSAEYIQIDPIGGIGGRFWSQIAGADLVAKIAAVAKERGVRHVHGDQREAYMLASEFPKHGLAFSEHAWTATSKPAAVERVRRWLADRALAFRHDTLRSELLRFEERITPTGQITFAARGTGHDDFVSLLVTLAMVDLAGQLPRVPAGQQLDFAAASDRVADRLARLGHHRKWEWGGRGY